MEFSRKKFTTRTTLGWEMRASERPSSKKYFRPSRNAAAFSSGTTGISSPGLRRASDVGRYSLMATGAPVSSVAR
ncbi:hypothetical protein D3C72_2406690 [compost metagenome]